MLHRLHFARQGFEDHLLFTRANKSRRNTYKPVSPDIILYILLPYASSVTIGFISHFCRPLWQRCGAHLQMWPILFSHQDTFSIFLFLSLQAAPKLATLANQSKLAWPYMAIDVPCQFCVKHYPKMSTSSLLPQKGCEGHLESTSYLPRLK